MQLILRICAETGLLLLGALWCCAEISDIDTEEKIAKRAPGGLAQNTIRFLVSTKESGMDVVIMLWLMLQLIACRTVEM